MASRGVNKVIIIGNLGNDPETRYFPSGDAVTNITVATSESWKDKQTGEQREATEWHRVQFNGRLAEIAGEYLKKGSKVYIEGSLRTRKWQDKASGQDRYTTEIRANNMQMLDSRGEGGGQAAGGWQQQQAAQPAASPQQAPQQQVPPQAPQQNYAQQPAAQPMQQSAPQQPIPPQQAPASAPQQQPAPAASGFDGFDDDIPF